MLLPLLLLLALGAIWGVSTTIAKVAVTTGMSPIAYGFWQCVIAALLLLSISAVRRRWPPIDRRHLFYYVFTGLIGLAIPALNMYAAVARIPAGLMASIVATAPLMTYALALLARTERFDALRGLGILVGLGGALMILLPRSSLPTEDMVFWAAIALATPALYAVNAVVAGRLMPAADALTLAAGMVTSAALGFGAGVVIFGGMTLPWPPDSPAALATFWHGVSSVAAYALYFQIIRLAGAVYMSQVGYLVIAIGVAAGMIVFDERHSVWVWLAITAMLVGLTLVNVGQRRLAARSGSRTA